MNDNAVPAHLDPRVEEFLAATERLTAPGSPFELVSEDVLGEPMRVFGNRPASLREVLVDSAAHGDRLAMAFSDGREITFAQFNQQVASVAAYLRDVHGIEKGDNVAICGANGAGWILSFWATLSLGAVAVAMNGWWTEAEMVHALELTEPRVLLIDAKRAERLAGADLAIPTADLDADLDAMLAHDPAAAMPDTPIDEDDPAMLIFTSGTTGRAKAAVLTHRSIVAYSQLQNFIGARGMMLAGRAPSGGPPPVRLAVFPLFHVSGLGATVNSTMTGSTTVWPLGRFDAATVIDLTLRYGINVWGGTGTHVVRLLEHPDLERIPEGQLVDGRHGRLGHDPRHHPPPRREPAAPGRHDVDRLRLHRDGRPRSPTPPTGCCSPRPTASGRPSRRSTCASPTRWATSWPRARRARSGCAARC